MMKEQFEVIPTKLDRVFLVKPTFFEDFRGQYVCDFRADFYKSHFGFAPVEHDFAYNVKGVLRGIHYSPNDYKVYECIHGKLFYAIVNCDEKDPEFGKSQTFLITGENHLQIVKPPKYAAGMLALTEGAILHYLQDEYYVEGSPNQRSFKWDDPRFHIAWPTVAGGYIMSERDKQGAYAWEKK